MPFMFFANQFSIGKEFHQGKMFLQFICIVFSLTTALEMDFSFRILPLMGIKCN